MKHVFLGRGVFTSADTVEVAGKKLKFHKVRLGPDMTWHDTHRHVRIKKQTSGVGVLYDFFFFFLSTLFFNLFFVPCSYPFLNYFIRTRNFRSSYQKMIYKMVMTRRAAKLHNERNKTSKTQPPTQTSQRVSKTSKRGATKRISKKSPARQVSRSKKGQRLGRGPIDSVQLQRKQKPKKNQLKPSLKDEARLATATSTNKMVTFSPSTNGMV